MALSHRIVTLNSTDRLVLVSKAPIGVVVLHLGAEAGRLVQLTMPTDDGADVEVLLSPGDSAALTAKSIKARATGEGSVSRIAIVVEGSDITILGGY